MDLYNVMVFYEGEGSTNIYIPGNGDTQITNGRPIYVKNANFNVIEALRSFRKMDINIKIGVGPVGAFRTIDLGVQPQVVRPVQQVKEQVTNADISSILSSATNGPIVIDKPKTEDYGSYVLPSGKFAGKTLKEVDKEGKLKAVYNGYKTRSPEIKQAIEKYYDSQISK